MLIVVINDLEETTIMQKKLRKTEIMLLQISTRGGFYTSVLLEFSESIRFHTTISIVTKTS